MSAADEHEGGDERSHDDTEWYLVVVRELYGDDTLVRSLARELRGASDRVVAIVHGAILDDMLHDLIVRFLIDDKRVADELLGAAGPIGSFATRMKIAYCMGLINEVQYEDLNYIRKIRNRFAHQVGGQSFEQEPVRGWCKKHLGLARRLLKDGVSARDAFSIEVGLLEATLHCQANQLKAMNHRGAMYPHWPGMSATETGRLAKAWETLIGANLQED